MSIYYLNKDSNISKGCMYKKLCPWICSFTLNSFYCVFESTFLKSSDWNYSQYSCFGKKTGPGITVK